MFFSRLVISALKTTVLKREMLLEFMSYVSVTFIQKTYKNDSVRLVTMQAVFMPCYSALNGNTGQKCSTIETAF